jgi:hypothetical protein
MAHDAVAAQARETGEGHFTGGFRRCPSHDCLRALVASAQSLGC